MKFASNVRKTSLLCALHLLTVRPAVAQVPSPTPTVESAAPASARVSVGPDLVRLQDGSLWRGTIVEQVPKSHVVIVTFTGEPKRFAASDVKYAGPSPEQPSSPAVATPAPSAAPAEVSMPVAAMAHPAPAGTIKLTLRPPANLSIYADSGSGMALLCHGECVAPVVPGPYRFAIGSGLRAPTSAPGLFDIREDDELVGQFESRRGSRIAGGIVLGVGLLGGIVGLASGIRAKNQASDTCNAIDGLGDCNNVNDNAGRGGIAFGVVSAVVGAVIGIVLLSRKDRAVIHARKASQPMSHGSMGAEQEASVTSPETTSPPDDPDLSQLGPRVRGCLDGAAALVRVSIAADGSVSSREVITEAGWTVRSCIEGVIDNLVFEPGKPRTLHHSF